MDRTLPAWLSHIEALHPSTIEMGLDRVAAVYARLAAKPRCPTVIVAGTNGKGSVCAMLAAILQAEGYRVARYTSPHIERFNERIVIDGREATDADLVLAFEAVDAARGDVSLTYFEFTTLAAFWLFARAGLDAWIVEVGLGGRLDATNVLDADCAILTSIGIDHTDYLGPTREHIATEKAGVFRLGRPAIIGEPEVPVTLRTEIARIGAEPLWVGVNFSAVVEPMEEVSARAAKKVIPLLQSQNPPPARPPLQWRFRGRRRDQAGLPFPALRGRFQLGNAALALAALDALEARLPVRAQSVRTGLLAVDWPARFQVLPGQPTVILDVAHNGHAATVLAQCLADMRAAAPSGARCHAVWAMLADKDAADVAHCLHGEIDHWHVATLGGARGRTADALATVLEGALAADSTARPPIARYPDVASAIVAARQMAQITDRIVVFGSFHTVAEAANALQHQSR